MSPFEWDMREAGVDVMETAGTPLPDETLASIKENKVALKGPITTPIGTGFRSVNVALRHELGLYACLRPCKSYPGVRSRYDDVDLVIVRENTEDLYAGIEYEAGHRGGRAGDRRAERACRRSRSPPAPGISVKPISRAGSERIIRFAFEYARAHGRKRVSCVTKANIMKFTDGLFLDVFRGVAKDYPDIEPWENLVDAVCMGLVQRPEEFDVLVLPNLYGDIVSDLTAGLVGGLGVAPGGNIGPDTAVFEATHGSAPKYKGQNKVNPTAMILSGKLMLEHLGEDDAARAARRRRRRGDRRGRASDLRHEAVARRPDCGRDERVRGRDHREAGGITDMSEKTEGDDRRCGRDAAQRARRCSRSATTRRSSWSDIKEGLPQGKALDINQMGAGPRLRGERSPARTTTQTTAGSDVVVITAGLPRQPGMSRDDLVPTNEKIVKSVTEQVVAQRPGRDHHRRSRTRSTRCAMWRRARPASRGSASSGRRASSTRPGFRHSSRGRPARRSRTCSASCSAATATRWCPSSPRRRVGGVPIRKLVSEERIQEMVQRTAVGGGEVVKLLGHFGVVRARRSRAQMVDSIVLDEKRVLPCTAYLEGEYGIDGLYMGVPVKLGRSGIEEIYEVDLDDEERAALAKSADAVRDVVGVLSHVSWRIAGAYFESCNCEAICPCRMIGAVPGGRSTLRRLLRRARPGASTSGHFDDVDLSGLATALVVSYDDDEPGSPWSIVLHVDERGDDAQRAALEEIFLGDAGGDVMRLPWIRKPRNVIGVQVSAIELDGTSLRVGEAVRVDATDAVRDGRARRVRHPGLRPGGHGVHDRPVRRRRRPVPLAAQRQLRVRGRLRIRSS